MKLEALEPQFAADPIDELTQAALEKARSEARRGEVFSLEQSNQIIRKGLKEWRKTHQEVLAE